MVPNEGKDLKRKRPGVSKQDTTDRLTGKLHHGLKEVRKAAKKAKAFELQKVVKKLKSLRSKTPNSPEITAMEEQLKILKELEHEPYADTALKTKIKKEKSLADNPHVIEAMASELAHNLVVPAIPGSNLAKVQGRMFSSKLIAIDVSTVIGTLKAVLSPEKRKQRPEGRDESGDEEIAPTRVKKTRLEVSDDEYSDDESPHVEEISEHEEDEGDDGWESDSVRENEDGGTSQEDLDEGEDMSEDDGANSEGGEESDDGSGTPQKASTSEKPPKSTSKPGESTFLPSLSVGFTRGDSDASDVDENELKAVNGGTKKNRRGQRARRAIWEKKYGKNANHVKKEQATSQKNTDTRLKRLTTQIPGQRARQPPRHDVLPQAHSQGRAMQSQRSTTHKPKQREEEKPLHPSWEAKRRLKEKQSPSIVAPQGQKIVFSS